MFVSYPLTGVYAPQPRISGSNLGSNLGVCGHIGAPLGSLFLVTWHYLLGRMTLAMMVRCAVYDTGKDGQMCGL